MPTLKEQLEPIIREMLWDGSNFQVTSLEIADEATKRLGVKVTDTYVSALRNRINLGFRQMVIQDQFARRQARTGEGIGGISNSWIERA